MPDTGYPNYLKLTADGTIDLSSFVLAAIPAGQAPIVAWGRNNVSFTGRADSDNTFIAHGMSRQPAAITIATNNAFDDGLRSVTWNWQNVNNNDFLVRAINPAGALVANVPFTWIAIA